MKNVLKETAGLFIGNLLLAFAVGMFLLPNNVLSGGVSGISLLLSPFIPLDEATIILGLNVILLLSGWACLGFKFMVNSCVSSLLYPILLMIIQSLFTVPVVDPLLAAIFGGLLAGVGVGIVIKQGASTGGMDIPPLIANKYLHVDVSKAVMVTDALTVVFGLFVYGFEEVLIGLVSVYVTAVGLSKALTYGTGEKAKSLQIISDKYEAISQAIQEKLERGVTFIESEGGYTRERRKLVLVAVSDKEYSRAINIINAIDRKAFVIVTDATDVHGEGFTDIVRI